MRRRVCAFYRIIIFPLHAMAGPGWRMITFVWWVQWECFAAAYSTALAAARGADADGWLERTRQTIGRHLLPVRTLGTQAR